MKFDILEYEKTLDKELISLLEEISFNKKLKELDGFIKSDIWRNVNKTDDTHIVFFNYVKTLFPNNNELIYDHDHVLFEDKDFNKQLTDKQILTLRDIDNNKMPGIFLEDDVVMIYCGSSLAIKTPGVYRKVSPRMPGVYENDSKY